MTSLALSKNETKEIKETLYFDECGIMLDLSRNAVMRVDSVKKYANYMALMGLNQLYLNKDKVFLRECVDKFLPELRESYIITCECHRKEWYRVNKPYGFEVLDVRYGGMINRINTAILRLKQYLDGEIDFIEELESERLLHRCEGKQRRFANIMTASTNI